MEEKHTDFGGSGALGVIKFSYDGATGLSLYWFTKITHLIFSKRTQPNSAELNFCSFK